MNLHFDVNRALKISVWAQIILWLFDSLLIAYYLDLHPTLVKYLELQGDFVIGIGGQGLWAGVFGIIAGFGLIAALAAPLFGLLLEYRWVKTSYLFLILVELTFGFAQGVTIFHPLESLSHAVYLIATGFTAAILLLTDVKLEKRTQKLKNNLGGNYLCVHCGPIESLGWIDHIRKVG